MGEFHQCPDCGQSCDCDGGPGKWCRHLCDEQEDEDAYAAEE